MADIILEQGQTLPPETQTKYRELADGSYALVVAPEETEISQINGVTVEMDTVTGAQVTIPVQHHEVHEGEMFISSYKSADASPIADDASLTIHIFTGTTKFPHLIFQTSAGGDAEVQFYEGTIVTNNGTPLADASLNRANVGTPEVATFHTPTVTADGMELLTLFLPGGEHPRAGGGVIRADTEWILKRETHYLVRLTNRAGGAQPLGIAQTWYEESNA